MNGRIMAVFAAILAVGILGAALAASQDVTAQGQAGQDIIKSKPPSFDTPQIQRMAEIARELTDHTITKDEKAALIAKAAQIKKSITANTDASKRQTVMDKQSLISNYIIEGNKAQAVSEFRSEFPVTGTYVDDFSNQLVINILPDDFSDNTVAKVITKIREIVGYEIDIIVQPMPAMIPH